MATFCSDPVLYNLAVKGWCQNVAVMLSDCSPSAAENLISPLTSVIAIGESGMASRASFSWVLTLYSALARLFLDFTPNGIRSCIWESTLPARSQLTRGPRFFFTGDWARKSTPWAREPATVPSTIKIRCSGGPALSYSAVAATIVLAPASPELMLDCT